MKLGWNGDLSRSWSCVLTWEWPFVVCNSSVLLAELDLKGTQVTSSFRVRWQPVTWWEVGLESDRTVARARCELGHHLGSMVVTTLWWGQAWPRPEDLRPALLTLAPLSWWSCSFCRSSAKGGAEARGFWVGAWVVLGRPVTVNSGFQSAVSALWLRGSNLFMHSLRAESQWLPTLSGEPHWS